MSPDNDYVTKQDKAESEILSEKLQNLSEEEKELVCFFLLSARKCHYPHMHISLMYTMNIKSFLSLLGIQAGPPVERGSRKER